MATWQWIVIGLSVWVGLSALLTALWVMIGAKLLRYPRRFPRRHRRERQDNSDWETAA
jgi:hypothetical protein